MPVSKEAGKESLSTAADFIKYATGFATGALVFSAGLVDKMQHMPHWTVIILITSWALLTVSVVAGVMAFSRIPIQQSEENYDLENPWFTWPGKIHQGAFMLGVLTLGFILITLLNTSNRDKRAFKVNSAAQAVSIARQHIPKGKLLRALLKIELQPGVGEPETALPVWSVSYAVQTVIPLAVQDSLHTINQLKVIRNCTQNCRYRCRCSHFPLLPASTSDTAVILIDALTGDVISIP